MHSQPPRAALTATVMILTATIGLASEPCIYIESRMDAVDAAARQQVRELLALPKAPKGFREGQETRHLRVAYPDTAVQQGLEGTVVMRALVGVDGKVRSIQHSVGPEPLVKAVLARTKDLRYRPYEIDGIKKEMIVDLSVHFSLPQRCRPARPPQ